MNEEESRALHEKIKELLGEKNVKELKKLLAEENPVDIAEALDGLDEKEILLTYRLLPKESAADLFVAADPEFQEVLVKGFSDTELRAVMDEIYLDEAADLRAVQGAWPDIAGAPLCRLTEPIKLEKGVLTLRLDHPMLLMELRGPLQQELLRRLHSRVGPKAVTSLRLLVG